MDDQGDDFRSGGFLVLQRRAAPPPPADEGEIAGEAPSDPSLPTTGWRGRRQPPNLVQLAGGGVASWNEVRKRSVGQGLRRSEIQKQCERMVGSGKRRGKSRGENR